MLEFAERESPDERKLLNGLVYMTHQKLEHKALACSNVLVTNDGDVKIGKSTMKANSCNITILICAHSKSRELSHTGRWFWYQGGQGVKCHYNAAYAGLPEG
jgi:hypothetical protein